MTAQAETVRVCAVQARLQFYGSAAEFRGHMSELMSRAAAYEPDLVVFPEDVGTPLIALGDEELLGTCGTLREAIGAMTLRHAGPLAPIMGRWGCSPQRALFLLKAAAMREIYTETFADLARRYRVTIAAGSILLSPAETDDGSVYNTMLLFGPAGAILGQADKVNLIPLELADGLDICCGSPERLQALPTPLGRVGLLICADAWSPGLAAQLKEQGAQLLINCLANPEAWTDAVAADMAQSLPARIAETALPGVQAHGVGNLFELPFRGRSKIMAPEPGGGIRVVAQAKSVDEEEIVCGELEL